MWRVCQNVRVNQGAIKSIGFIAPYGPTKENEVGELFT